MAEVAPARAPQAPGAHAPRSPAPVSEPLLDEEADFYQGYSWCLNPYPTVVETVEHLAREIERMGAAPAGWRAAEVRANVYLLSCALMNSVDDYLGGTTFRLPRRAAAIPLSGSFLWAAERLAALARAPRRACVRRWKETWRPRFEAFVSAFLAEESPGPAALAELGAALRLPLPADLLTRHTYFPSAFRKHDLTHHDVPALGRRFAERFPDRRRRILVVGLRTAGSYFAPLLQTFLRADGYATVDAVTIRPDRGPGPRERAEMARCAREGRLALILDDAPGGGAAVVQGVEAARQTGFAAGAVAILVPVHPANCDWRGHAASASLSDAAVVTLEAEDWHKNRLLDPKRVETLLAEYYQARGFSGTYVTPSAEAERLDARLRDLSDDPRRARMKRIFEVRLEAPNGRVETRYVLAKSVGWGWLGYHAFLAGRRLVGFVPPLLGLRDGLLYSEWLPQAAAPDPAGAGREEWIRAAASYVAARARSLGLGRNPLPTLGPHQHHDGFGLLDRVLGKAYGGSLAAGLRRPRVRRRLSTQPCPLPALIDGKMEPSEWVIGPGGLLKTDYEHHGMGKNELNVTDPAYDLAEAILHLSLSPEEEKDLLCRYAEESGDSGVGRRLLLNKLLAGTWATASALKGLFARPDAERRLDFHRRFVAAWHFLTVHVARACGERRLRPKEVRWRSPLVVLDVDGVLDRRVFGFPCTTAAGVEALSLLHAHDFTVAVDTARSAGEVKEYCCAYGLAGGAAEYGGYLWDAVAGRGRVLVSPESLRQLDRARKALARLPGVFLDERYEYSIRAFTYEDKAPPQSRMQAPYALSSIRMFTWDDKATAPLPPLLMREVMAAERLDRLHFHQTGSDTAVTAREADKGTGLSALRAWVGLADAETLAVGDSEADLPMFGAATRCFAPAQIGCPTEAKRLGCRIAPHPFQRGLLSVVRSLIHPGGGRCRRCLSAERPWNPEGDLVLDLLRAADRKRSVALLAALLDPLGWRAFVR